MRTGVKLRLGRRRLSVSHDFSALGHVADHILS
ncbi:hypothetical protein PMI40_01600 [Herbaspirillum sp. YR522]|nr:hypothetical protein PMI40_01600 [Herbaspirillum sp. YR522]